MKPGRRDRRVFLGMLVCVLAAGAASTLVFLGLKSQREPHEVQSRTHMRRMMDLVHGWHAAHGDTPRALADVLAPLPWKEAARTGSDGWGQGFRYTVDGAVVELRSGGPDRRYATPDDLVLVDTLREGGEGR